jgi:hypothetical protein
MMKSTQGSANSRRSNPGEDLSSSPGHLVSAALSFGLPAFQANHPCPWPPVSRRSAAINHRRPPVHLTSEMAQFPAAANRNAKNIVTSWS